MSLLTKYITDLDDQEKAALRKPIGVKGRPYPMRQLFEEQNARGETVLVQRLGVLEENPPLVLYSERDYAEVYGMAIREMPTPGMLPAFKQAIERRNLSSRCCQYLEGLPGSGKTYMAELLARMRDPRGAIKVDCGNKNLAELLYETVLDFGQNKRLYDEFDKRLAAYNRAETAEEKGRLFNPHSMNILRASLGEAFVVDEKGKISIDWEKTNHCIVTEQKDDGTKTYLDQRETVEIVSKALSDVANKEGFGHLVANALGMATQEGPLIQAWKEGREIILDEFNRGKKDTTSSLHTILHFISGGTNMAIGENTLKEKGDGESQKFVFRRNEQRVGFFVTFTGNAEDDGDDVNELPESVRSRIGTTFIPLPTEQDWQHRICQIMAGMPVSTLYEASSKQWDDNPGAFRKKLQQWRTLGLSEDQKSVIPEMHTNLLTRWEDIKEASANLARFYYGWSQMVNPDSPLHKKADLAHLLEEIDEQFKKKVALDFRKIEDHIKEALEVQAPVIRVEESRGFDLDDDMSTPPVLSDDLFSEDPILHFGTRLTNAIMRHVENMTKEIGKERLYRKLKEAAESCGIISATFHEAKPNKRNSVAQLLDFNPYRSKVPEIQVQAMRDLLAMQLKNADPLIKASKDEIMTLPRMESAIDQWVKKNYKKVGERMFTSFNSDADSYSRSPFQKVVITDAAEKLLPEKTQEQDAGNELISQDDFLFSLMPPKMRQGNLSALWSDVFSRSGHVYQAPGNSAARDEGLAMAEGNSETGLSITSVMVAQNDNEEGKQTPVHVIWNRKSDTLLVVGEGESPASLKEVFNATATTYVNRLENDADRQVNAALNKLLGASRDKNEKLLTKAFLLRAQGGEASEKLSDLLIDRKAEIYMPVFLQKAPPQPAAA